ncbi:hypothetical protein [Amycolatopsis sp. TNS106]|uniref:hypothetical protein n=1 Tax=Amycolatopsis sp. TNS106 TaxID=2861750 RepID=UPI001C560661|nr:hypothetical protein [Amycolatopsis sp. TNS106]QXV56564.1 hypothetical protein CVV72_05705 [Amycolatopsis sp. TNS106]
MIKPRAKSDRWEEFALSVFLLVCFLLAFLKDLFPFLDKGLTAAIFAAIFFVLKQIRDMRIEVQNDGPGEVFFATNEEFYSSARDAVRGAEREVRVTYFRHVPPTTVSSAESREYFSEVLNFARRRGTVRRIIGIANDAMANWCVAQTGEVERNPRYNVRVIEMRNQTVEPMSICLIDDDTMYMAFSGPTDQQLGGIREDAPKLVHFHQNRFDQLWASGTDLQEFAKARTAATDTQPT